ncbi:MAG TPA: sarcosine oxidase subunit delta [Candidatus Thioglobus sp.]|jgi:sarcosine oxidase subunit delta|nr:sarcosine oxidase subunit delta [Candidatus Thioglobus sp.]HIL43196.1 sarcosine oxidase subunit delta [Gammaproteobacteria bacterium]
MLKIYCPHCQMHLEEEDFSYSGEALIARPNNPSSISDDEWGDYLFMRKNPKGRHVEQWQHSSGCRKFFVIERNTIDNTIYSSYTMIQASKEIKHETN